MPLMRWIHKPNRILSLGVIVRVMLLMHALWMIQSLQAMAHPMGNFSINHFSSLEIGQETIQLLYVIDMAEIPTFQEMQQQQFVTDPKASATNQYLREKAKELTKGLSLSINEKPRPLTIQSSDITFPSGAGDLPTLRIEILYETALPTATGTLAFENQNYSDRLGWREIVARSTEGITLTNSSVPQVSQSQQLTTYQQDLLETPPQDRKATVGFTLASTQQITNEANPTFPSTKISEPGDTSSPNALTELITTKEISFSMMIISMAVALGLGAFHALEPGHGKTLVAAYLVGSRGTPWHALLLGLTVTASHTIGVLALGTVTLFASQFFFPEQVYPWLGVTSGLLIMGTGALLLLRITKSFRHQHAHEAHQHHSHSHDPHSHHHVEGEQTSLRSLLTLGITGGMIPCPAALVVLLSAVALNRIGFGMLLIVAFSTGLALVLTTIGLLLVSAKGVVQRWQGNRPWFRYMPYVSPAVIMPLGLFIAIRSVIEIISDVSV